MILQDQDSGSAALSALLERLIDYAGLFPPSALSMQEAVRNYSAYLAGPDRWALGRFVLTVARFDEFVVELNTLSAQNWPWRIAALLGPDWQQDFDRAHRLHQETQGRALADVVEVKFGANASPAQFKQILPPDISAFCELDPPDWSRLPEIRDAGLAAKIRTGGVIENAIPNQNDIADFLLACAELKLPFKATAGLHHPLRCVKPLTYEPHAPQAMMHGFLNVFLAAALAFQHASREEILQLLADSDINHFSAEDDCIAWRNRTFSTEQLRSLRANFAISFGSCSFEEPLSDLKELGLL